LYAQACHSGMHQILKWYILKDSFQYRYQLCTWFDGSCRVL